MASLVKFTATKLPAGKKGILACDENGYYTMPVGALNVFNSVGAYYKLEGAAELFKGSSVFMRRVANGCLKGETGHPKRLPGMTMDQYMSRILSIEETNVCCHFKEIWLDENYGRNNPQFNNPNMVAIMAKIKPAGPKGDALKAAFDNNDENVCFSIRSLTRDFVQRGQVYKVIEQIIGWDWVTEPGISMATQWSAPALETLQEDIVTQRNVEKMLKVRPASVSLEDNLAIAQESLQVFTGSKKEPPLFTKW